MIFFSLEKQQIYDEKSSYLKEILLLMIPLRRKFSCISLLFLICMLVLSHHALIKNTVHLSFLWMT